LIRPCEEGDFEELIRIWYDASVLAHAFVPAKFWAEQKEAMRNTYFPAVENWVFEGEGEVQGFISLIGGRVCALFVKPGMQGKGIGTALIKHAKALKGNLSLKVYRENKNALHFYEKCGFLPIAKETDKYTGCKQLLMELEKERQPGETYPLSGTEELTGF
jgi:putative acetyltransferase